MIDYQCFSLLCQREAQAEEGGRNTILYLSQKALFFHYVMHTITFLYGLQYMFISDIVENTISIFVGFTISIFVGFTISVLKTPFWLALQ